MTRRAVWGIYLVLYLAFEGWAFSQSPVPHSFSITNGAYLLFLIGVGGLALNVRILTERFWRIVFGVSVLFLIHNWLVMPFVYFRSQGLGWNQVAIIQALSVPALPIFPWAFHLCMAQSPYLAQCRPTRRSSRRGSPCGSARG